PSRAERRRTTSATDHSPSRCRRRVVPGHEKPGTSTCAQPNEGHGNVSAGMSISSRPVRRYSGPPAARAGWVSDLDGRPDHASSRKKPPAKTGAKLRKE